MTAREIVKAILSQRYAYTLDSVVDDLRTIALAYSDIEGRIRLQNEIIEDLRSQVRFLMEQKASPKTST